MTRRRPNEIPSDSREAEVAAVLLDVLLHGLHDGFADMPDAPPEAPVEVATAPLLVVDDVDGHLAAALPAAVRWSRVARGDQSAAAWPPAGPHPGATLRLPKAKAALDLAVHAIASTLPPGAPLWLYGANDEGIRSVAGRLAGLFDDVVSISARRRCRVWQARRTAAPAQAPLSAWRQETRLLLPGAAGGLEDVAWVEYPGVFAAGRLDAATAVLLEVIAPVAPGASVLDFGCGAGAIAAVIRRRAPHARLHLLDADAVALQAARENVPGATVHLGDGWAAAPGLVVDRIISNPPIHRGKREDYSALAALIDEAPRHLASGGSLEIVVQRRLPVRPRLEAAFGRVESAFEDPRWQVWRAS